jgi:hypothetical protein
VDSAHDAALSLDVNVPWQITLTAPGCWASPVTVPALGKSVVEMHLWRRGELRIRLDTHGGNLQPKHLSARLQTAGSDLGDVACSRREDGTWRCDVPATTIDTRLNPEGYAPTYIFDAKIQASLPFDAGTAALTRGASVSGWVAGGQRGVRLDDVVVDLVPVAGDAPAAAQKIAANTTHPNKRGFFQFSAVPFGTYKVQARKKSFSAAEAVLGVSSSGESVVEGVLMLKPLSRLEVIATPPLTPRGAPWSLRVSRIHPESHFTTMLAQERMPVDGFWLRDALEQGGYEVCLVDESGSVHARERFDLDAVRKLVPIHIDDFRVRGTVTSGSHPIDGSVVFSSREGSRITVESDADGRFEGWLPAEGSWGITVVPKGTSAGVRTRKMEVRRRADADYAVVDITLPAGRLRGSVVDEKQHPVNADVIVRTLEGTVAASAGTNAGGLFDFIGLDTGIVTVSAETETLDSGRIFHSISGNDDAQIQIVAKGLRRIRGRVTATDERPVAGATVRAMGDGFVNRIDDVTAPDGSFILSVPATTSVLDIAVIASGFPIALRSARIPESETRPIGIIVGGPAGTMLVRLGDIPPWPWVRRSDGGFHFLRSFNAPSFGGAPFPNMNQGGVLEYEVEAGTYSLCPQQMAGDACLTREVGPGQHVLFDATHLWTSDEKRKRLDNLP